MREEAEDTVQATSSIARLAPSLLNPRRKYSCLERKHDVEEHHDKEREYEISQHDPTDGKASPRFPRLVELCSSQGKMSDENRDRCPEKGHGTQDIRYAVRQVGGHDSEIRHEGADEGNAPDTEANQR